MVLQPDQTKKVFVFVFPKSARTFKTTPPPTPSREEPQPRGAKNERQHSAPLGNKKLKQNVAARTCTCTEAHLLRVRSGDTSIRSLRQNVSAGRPAEMSKLRAWLPPVAASLLISQQHLVVTESTEESERLPQERRPLESLAAAAWTADTPPSASTGLSVRQGQRCFIFSLD